MALVQYGGGVVNFRGSIAGNTFQRNRAGEIVRGRGVRTGRATAPMSNAQSLTANLTALWMTVDHTNWDDFARTHPFTDRFGQTKNLSGFNYFVSINTIRTLTGHPEHLIPPDYILPPQPNLYTFKILPNNLTIFFEQLPNNPEVFYFIYFSPPLSFYTTKLRSPLRLVTIIPADTPSPLNITQQWKNTFGFQHPTAPPLSYAMSGYLLPANSDTGLTGIALQRAFFNE